MAFDHDAAKRSVLAVGPGRGFVVETNDDLLVMTAAHCLPRLPEPGPPDVNQLTILNLIGALGGDLTVAAGEGPSTRFPILRCWGYLTETRVCLTNPANTKLL